MQKIIFVFLLFFSLTAKAQYKNPYFNTLSVEKGLPEGNIQAYLQDKFGYMWFATQNGLVRYDGYNLKPYSFLNDRGEPLIYSSINFIHEDRAGKIWAVARLEGLYCLDRQKDAFYKVKMDTATSNAISDDFFQKWIEDNASGIHVIVSYDTMAHLLLFDAVKNNVIDFNPAAKGKYFIPSNTNIETTKDNYGKIWVSTGSELNLYDPATRTINKYAAIPDSIKQFMLYGLVPDPLHPDIIWCSLAKTDSAHLNTPFRKLARFNTKTKTWKIFPPPDNSTGSIVSGCIHVFSDSLKRIWCSTEKGMSLYNPAEENFTNYALDLPPSLTDEKTHVEVIAADKEGNLWLAGFFKGIAYLNVKNGLASLYKHNDEPGSLPDHQGINFLFFDRLGTLWVNMPYSGIAYLDKQKSLFNPFSVRPSLVETGGKASPDEFYIYCKYQDSLFLVKDSIGMYAWNYHQNSFTKIDLAKYRIYKQINCILVAKDNRIWVGTSSAGLFCYDPVTKAVKNYKKDAKDSLSISSNNITSLAEDKEGNIWVGTGDKGLCCLNKQTGKYTRFPFINNNGAMKANNELDDANAQCLFFDTDGILWIGTNFGGLNRFDTKTNQFKSYGDFKKGFACITTIYEDSRKRLWAGTYLTGLFLVDKKLGSVKRYTQEDGLLHNSISNIIDDAAGNLWVCTPRGLSRLDEKADHFISYNISTKANLLTSSSMFRAKDGALQVSVPSGLILFDPDHMNENKIPPVVMIESVSYRPGNKENKKDTSVYTHGLEKTELHYNENKITIQYVALHYADAPSNQYLVKLDGYDNDWIPAGTQRSATYTNLNPGTYTFHVKACNSDGVWNETGASYVITILPPWWKTWWAYTLFALAFIVIILSYIGYRSAALKKENKVLEEKVELRTSQLQTSIADLKATQSQLIQSEKMASLGELTAGIAHEIQNPLNFVNNFSEVNAELIEELRIKSEKLKIEDEEVKELLHDIKDNSEKINHHGKRADAIVKGMLQHSRSSNGVKEPTDINALCDEYLRLAYHGIRAKDKSFNATLKTDFDDKIGKINIIPQDIGRVILNLITNAFYAVNTPQPPKGGVTYVPTVSVATKKVNGKVEVKVSDNGTGIPKNIIDKIFQPFFTTKPTGQGTGLGLSLSYDIIKAHGGELKVETKDGEGSEFIIQIPVA
ncbi:MAG: two-component regulator propeller domain-containing protein [Ferruginibacter sp.]